MLLPAKSRPALTLIELLIATAIIGVLLGMLLPAIYQIRELVNRTRCQSNLKSMGTALLTYYDQEGHFPPSYIHNPAFVSPAIVAPPVKGPPDKKGLVVDRIIIPPGSPVIVSQGPGWGWGALLLPYLDQVSLSKKLNLQTAVEDPAMADFRTTPLSVYICPSDSQAGIVTMMSELNQPIGDAATNSYAGCYGALKQLDLQPDNGTGLLVRNGKFRIRDVPDGVSNTLAIGERAAMLAQTPWAGVMSGAVVVTTPGAPVLATMTEGAPTQVMARIGNRTLLAPTSEPYDFFSPHRGVVQFAFADGSVHILRDDVSIPVLQALATRAGKETIAAGDY